MASSVTIQSVKSPAKPFTSVGAQVQRAISRIAESDYPVLIQGESGTGKRTVAAQIHAQSHQPRGYFKQIDCKDADELTLTSCFSAKGTLYLAEIAELAPSLQELIVKTFFRPAQPQTCRLLCGSSRELSEEVRLHRVREDFFYHISAVTLRISPLRFRKSEILSIADELLTQYSRQFDRPRPVLRKEIVKFLTEHSWPGNLTELQTAIKTLVAIEDQAISLAALKAAHSAAQPNAHRESFSLKQATRAASSQIERQLIAQVLTATGGNRKRAADELRISYKALLYKLKQIGTETQFVSSKDGVAS